MSKIFLRHTLTKKIIDILILLSLCKIVRSSVILLLPLFISYIMAVSLIGRGNRSTRRKPPRCSHWNDSGNFDTGVRIVDVSGDGLPDFLKCDTTGDCRSWTNMTSMKRLVLVSTDETTSLAF
jgi:hypothetical protein